MAVFRKLKSKLKSLIQKKKASEGKAPAKPRIFQGKKMQPQAAQEAGRKSKQEALGVQEVAVEATKFSHPQARKFTRTMPEELPGQYQKDRIVLQVRDPWWLHAYWEVTPQTFDCFRERLKDSFHAAKRALRVYDVSHIVFDGSNAHRFFDIEVGPDATNWYIDTGGPGRSWCVDFGIKLASGEFITIVRSNTVHTPLEGPSWITDEEWMIPDERFGRLYGMGFGLGQSSPVGKAWQERVKRALFSGILASPGITSAASPVKKLPKARTFWLVVDCELIDYGATEPDAAVTVQGKPIALRPDGTFTLRFALPDGKQVIPVHAVSNDREEERTITPLVTRETK